MTQFLGAPGELLLFDRPATLAVYAATDDPDEPVGLRGHPRWAELTERPEVDFTRSRTMSSTCPQCPRCSPTPVRTTWPAPAS